MADERLEAGREQPGVGRNVSVAPATADGSQARVAGNVARLDLYAGLGAHGRVPAVDAVHEEQLLERAQVAGHGVAGGDLLAVLRHKPSECVVGKVAAHIAAHGAQHAPGGCLLASRGLDLAGKKGLEVHAREGVRGGAVHPNGLGPAASVQKGSDRAERGRAPFGLELAAEEPGQGDRPIRRADLGERERVHLYACPARLVRPHVARRLLGASRGGKEKLAGGGCLAVGELLEVGEVRPFVDDVRAHAREGQAGVRLDQGEHDILLVAVGDALRAREAQRSLAAAPHAGELKNFVGIE